MKLNRNKKNHKKIFVFSILIFLIAAGSIFTFITKKQTNTDDSNKTAETVNGPNSINMNSPTENDIQENNQHKEDLAKNEEIKSDSTANSKTVKPIITSSEIYENNVEVISIVPDIFEESGRCTLSLTKGSAKVDQSKNAVPNVSEMSCGLIKIPVSKLSAGDWAVVVSYNSKKYSGKSDSINIRVD